MAILQNKNGLIVGASNTMIADIGGYRRDWSVPRKQGSDESRPQPSAGSKIYSVKKDQTQRISRRLQLMEYNDKIGDTVRRTSMMPASRNGNVNANLGARFSNSSNTVKDFQAQHLPHAQAG